MANYIQIDERFWDEIKDGENIVIYHNGEEKDIVVPEELGGHPVTRIGKLKPTDEVESITIPKTVTVIEDDAFEGFPKDFVIYCYPGTQYSNKDGYKIVYLEENEESQEEEPLLGEAPVEASTTEEPVEETVVETKDEPEEVLETTVKTPIEVIPATDNSNTILGVIIFVIALVLLGVAFVLKGKK